ncbi:MAG: thioredoxin family protein [Gemmatimonadaceae bacterium]
MDAARFVTGQTFEEFVASATKYQELWTLGARRASVPADVVERFNTLRAPLRLVVLNEDWCLDAVGVVPYLSKLSEEISAIELRSFGRDANPDLMDAHLTGTSQSIPVVIAYDHVWNELGWWGPRPAELQNWVMTAGALMPKPERYHYMRQWYARDHGATAMREICDMVMGALDAHAARSAIAG